MPISIALATQSAYPLSFLPLCPTLPGSPTGSQSLQVGKAAQRAAHRSASNASLRFFPSPSTFTSYQASDTISLLN
ncbi:MAG: hypothetical protein IGS49_06855 [Chlorogloeopsis fritschii C42_A2020_084]|uniref:hypothetical protein n=1 Tax=Chlorogloeopsis fritschii TaxID=1124 RepID=UPI001A0DD1C5|nr:hypothetical protein [Chlorogloeopsis fritschii]MBF2005181.1 hypothetical protein [Chlorogloeopsis fritschii C42_A2020_084]